MKPYYKLVLIMFILASLFYLLKSKGLFDTFPETNLGNPIWAIDIPTGEIITSSPLFSENILYVQTKNKVIAFNARNGTTLWTTDLLIPHEEAGYSGESQTLIEELFLIAHSSKNLINALNKKTGELIWSSRQPYGYDGNSSTSAATILDLAIQNNSLFVSRLNTSIASYDIKNGNLMWVSDAPMRTDLELLPQGDALFVRTLDTFLMYDLVTGDQYDSYQLSGDVISSYYEGGIAYLNFDNGVCSISAVDLETLQVLWCTKFNNYFFSGEIYGNSTDSDNVYVVGSFLAPLNKLSGSISWKIDANYKFEYAGVSNGIIYVIDSGDIYLIDEKNGEIIQRINMPEEFLTYEFLGRAIYPPIFTQDTVILLSKNKITKYKIPSE